MNDTTRNPPTEAGFSLPHIAARFFDTPLLIQPDKVSALAWALRGKLNLNVERPEGDVMEASGPGLFGENMDPRTGYFVDRGVAVIPIRGTLVNRGAWIGSYSGLMSYEGIARQIDLVAKDDRVRGVMFDVHSYGGEATGVDDLGRMIRALNKPTYAMIDGAGASAAYWISAACDRVYIANSSQGGRIGVVITHASFQQALDADGITVTHIHAGAEKVLGSPYKDLSDSDREKLQAKVDKTYRAFVEGIAEFRRMNTEDVRATEAAVFDGPELVDAGLADGVTTSRRLLAAIQDDFENPDPDREPGLNSGNSRTTTSTSRGETMTKQTEGGASSAAEHKSYTQADVDALQAKTAADQSAAVAAAASAERERISAILSCEEAEARPAAAKQLAMSTDMNLEAAQAFLSGLPAEGKANGTGLAAAMANQQPGISADDDAPAAETNQAPAQINAADIYARRAAAGK